MRIEEHYTDTAGFIDHVFALCHFLGFEFAPRIADLADKNLYVPGKPGDWPALSSLIGGSINRTVTASLILRKLSAYPRQNGLAVGPARTRPHRAHAVHTRVHPPTGRG